MAKPKRKPVEGVGPTPERAKQVTIDVVKSPESDGVVRRIRNPLTIDDWREKGRLTPDEHSAAVAFANIWQCAKGSLVRISRYDPDPAINIGLYEPEAAVQLSQIYRGVGMIASRWLDGVIIRGESLRTLERMSSVENGTGLTHFKAALRKLADVMGWPMT